MTTINSYNLRIRFLNANIITSSFTTFYLYMIIASKRYLKTGAKIKIFIKARILQKKLLTLQLSLHSFIGTLKNSRIYRLCLFYNFITFWILPVCIMIKKCSACINSFFLKSYLKTETLTMIGKHLFCKIVWYFFINTSERYHF